MCHDSTDKIVTFKIHLFKGNMVAQNVGLQCKWEIGMIRYIQCAELDKIKYA